MGDYSWSQPERRDLYLASRILAEGATDGDWVQWASDTLLNDVELYRDPRQGLGSWLYEDEASLADSLGEFLWEAVESNPFSAAELLGDPTRSELVRSVASRLVKQMEANGRLNVTLGS